MRKILCVTIIVMMLSFSLGFTLDLPDPISDLDYMKGNYYKTSDTGYTFKGIQVGDKTQGAVGSLEGNTPNVDVYVLTVLEDALITIEAVTLSKNYYSSLMIHGPVFIDDISGSKKWYPAGDANSRKIIEDYNSYGACLNTTYLKAGTYYFHVTGRAYSQESQATNYLTPVHYQMSVSSATFQNEPQGDTDQAKPYILKSQNDVISGLLRMEMGYSGGSFRSDSSDRIIIPAGEVRDVTLKVHNVHSNPLGIFKREIDYIRNNNDKKALETRKLLTTYTSDSKLSVSIQSNGSMRLLPDSFEVMTFTTEKDKSYYIDLSASYPTQYKVEYSEKLVDNTPTETSNDTSTTGETPEPSQPTVPVTNVVVKPSVGNDEILLNLTFKDKDTGAKIMPIEVAANGYKQVISAAGNVENQIVKLDGTDELYIAITATDYMFTKLFEKVVEGSENTFVIEMEKRKRVMSPDVVIHSACDIPQSVFDNGQYKLYVNNKDNFSSATDKGNVRGLANSYVNTKYDIRIEVEGYKPYHTEVEVLDNNNPTSNRVYIDIYVKTEKETLNTPESVSIEHPMTDSLNTASNWAKEEIQKSMAADLKTDKMTGMNFKDNASREAFCELVVKMYEKLGGQAQSFNNPFTDTTNQSVIKAYNVGIINGVTKTTFGPNESLTREQLCVMIMRAVEATNKVYELNPSFQKNYDDIDEISSWAKDSVQILNSYKIINGNGTSLEPQATVTKEMAVLMMYRAYEMFK